LGRQSSRPKLRSVLIRLDIKRQPGQAKCNGRCQFGSAWAPAFYTCPNVLPYRASEPLRPRRKPSICRLRYPRQRTDGDSWFPARFLPEWRTGRTPGAESSARGSRDCSVPVGGLMHGRTVADAWSAVAAVICNDVVGQEPVGTGVCSRRTGWNWL